MTEELNELEDEITDPDAMDENNVGESDDIEEEVDEKTVPLAALTDERAKRQNLEQQIDLYRAQLNSLQQNQPKQTDPFDELDDEEIITKEMYLRNQNKDKNEILEQIGYLKTIQKYPDYDNVVETYFRPLAEQDPDLLEIIKNSAPHKRYEMAYKIAKTNPDYKPTSGKEENLKTKSNKVIKNSKKVKSPSSITGSSGGVGNKWEEASLDEVLAEAERIIESG